MFWAVISTKLYLIYITPIPQLAYTLVSNFWSIENDAKDIYDFEVLFPFVRDMMCIFSIAHPFSRNKISKQL